MAKANKEIAIEAFENNDALEEVYVSKDGQPFGVLSDAQNYAQKFKKPEERKLDAFTRSELKVKQSKRDKNRVIDAVKSIKAAKNEQEVKELVAKEIRPFVLAQAKIRLKELGVSQAEANTSNIEELEQLKTQNAKLKEANEKFAKAAKDSAKKANDAEKARKKAEGDLVKAKEAKKPEPEEKQ